MRPVEPPVFSRRSFLFFIVLAPACLLAVGAIVAALQYKSFRALVSPAPEVEEFAWTSARQARADSLTAALRAFPDGASDTLRLGAEDLSVLAAASPTLRLQNIRFRVQAEDSLLVTLSSQRVDALRGRLAWLFRRMSPVADGWLNARVEGRPELKNGALGLAPERGFLNGAKVPSAALTKRAGLSPRDFIDPVHAAEYEAFVRALESASYRDGIVVLVKKNDE